MLRIATVVTVMVSLAVLLGGLGGCSSKISRENYDKVQTGMTVAQVKEILGEPAETKSGGASVLGIGGTASTLTWKAGDKTITLTFVNDQLTTKSMSNL